MWLVGKYRFYQSAIIRNIQLKCQEDKIDFPIKRPVNIGWSGNALFQMILIGMSYVALFLAINVSFKIPS